MNARVLDFDPQQRTEKEGIYDNSEKEKNFYVFLIRLKFITFISHFDALQIMRTTPVYGPKFTTRAEVQYPSLNEPRCYL